MLLAKSSLAGLLMEGGEEELATLLALSDLPDELDTVADADRLRALGLDTETIESLLPALDAARERTALTPADVRDLEQTISDRWADLVRHWTGPRPAER